MNYNPYISIQSVFRLMNFIKHFTMFLLIQVLITACSNNDTESHDPPVFVSSIPEDGEQQVVIDTSIEVVFNEAIIIQNVDKITINGIAADVRVDRAKLLFNQSLEKGITYEILIPKETVTNTFGVNLDHDIQVSFSTEEEVVIEITENLVTTNPSSQAVKVYNFLKENYGKKVLSATQAVPAWNINEAEWVKMHTGEYSAIAAFDYIFLDYSPANWIDYSSIGVVQDWWDNNGLVTASWHWRVPPIEGETDITTFVYQNETTFKPSNVPIEGTWENAIAKEHLDELISYIQLLQDQNIPMIWRPLHEAAGNTYVYQNGQAWFWWGAGGGEVFVTLWRFVFDYFKDKGINNLIWVWTSQTNDAAFYPGDEYVDMIGRDIYNNDNVGDIVSQFESLQSTYPTKMIALSEFGNTPKISAQWDAGAKWSFFMPWYDYDRTGDMGGAAFSQSTHVFADIDWWTDAFNQDYVFSRGEIPSLK